MFEILKNFFNFCDRENRRKFYGSIILGVFNSFFMALRIGAVAVMIQGVIRSLTQGQPFTDRTIWISFGIICFSVTAGIITKKNMSMWQTEGGYRTCAKKRIEIAEHLRYIPMGYFNENSLGQITSVTTNTMELVGDVATRAVMLVTQGLLDSALIIVMIFFFDWRIALVALAGFLLFQFVNVFMRLAVRGVSQEKNIADENMVSKILEYIQGIAEVRAYNLTGSRSAELNNVIERGKKTCLKMELRCIPIAALQSLVAKMTGVAIMLSSLNFYLAATMSLENCAVMLICSFMLFTALEAGGNYSALLRLIDIGVKKAQAILDVPTMNIEGKKLSHGFESANAASLNKDFALAKSNPCGNPDISAHITFAYDKKKIIDGVTLTIPARTTTAIVGPSGGEKQRISIARAIMKDAPIIILDEATANVDPENERDLMEAIKELTKEKTVIMIAHRLKTVRHADQIFVIDKGIIAEQGNHDQLVKKKGIYARFIDSREKAVSWKLKS